MTTKEEKFYFEKFKEKVFVLKIGGEVVSSVKILENILSDIKFLMQYGVRIILVHGGGVQADELANKLGFEPKKINGRRVTSADDLEVVKMLYGGSLNLNILSSMKKLGIKGMRISGLDGDLLDVEMRSNVEVDYGFVGEVREVNVAVLSHALNAGYLPVVSPLGVTTDGVIVNINADTVARAIACALEAEKLIFFTTGDGVYEGEKLLSILNVEDAYDCMISGVISGGMTVKVENCIEALRFGVKRVHIINGVSPNSLLLEVLTKSGVGTMIVSGKEESIYLKEN